MAGNTGGVGGESSPIESSKASGVPGEPSGGDLQAALHTPVRTLGELKEMLIKHLGKEKGTKLYNTFMKSFAMQVMSQVQHSAQQAQKAAQQMRQGPK